MPDESASDVTKTASPGSIRVLPEQIGPYRILDLLGEGGMGEVYKAERRQPMRQTVAIKIIKLGFNSREVITRFESERQALARMDHPNVARVLDAGTTDSGRPYFVMEYVPGVPITKFADDNKLSIKARLQLFTQACDAITHAHTKAIIHRDIKASNILAYIHDGKPTVKVIDFGIAKALTGDRLTDATFNTELGKIIGTYESMSPEQADGSPDIDTRTDVYSLGVLLYELLAGSQPFDHDTLAHAADQEIRRIIREVDPPRPSTRLSGMGESATKIASMRQAKVDALSRELRSELEWIPLKAMRKERDRRYISALQMSEDIDNYLGGRPLLAAPESKVYRLRKFVRRNKGPISAVAAVVIVLIAGVVGTTVGLIGQSRARATAEREEHHAKQQAEIAEAVNNFLGNMLSAADPGRLLGEKVTVLQAINAALSELERGELKDKPQVEASVRSTIGMTLLGLGQFDAAEPNLRKALELRRSASPPDYKMLGLALENLATLNQSTNKLSEAEDLFRQSLQAYRKALPPGDVSIAQCQANLALLLKIENKLDEAEPLMREALADLRKASPGGSQETATAIDDLANILQDKGKLNDAELLYREGLAMRRKVLPAGHPDIAFSLVNLATQLYIEGKPADAEPFAREALDIRVKSMPPEHPDIAHVHNTLAAILWAQDRLPEAEQQVREALTIDRKALPDGHPDITETLNNLAAILQAEGKFADAESMYRETLEAQHKSLPAQHEQIATTLNNLGKLFESEDKLDEAEKYLKDALAMRRAVLQEGHPMIAQSYYNVALLLRTRQKYAEAETHARAALESDRKTLPADHPDLINDILLQASILRLQEKYANAEALYSEALTIRNKALGPHAPPTTQAAEALAKCIDKQNRPADAAAIRAQYLSPSSQPSR